MNPQFHSDGLDAFPNLEDKEGGISKPMQIKSIRASLSSCALLSLHKEQFVPLHRAHSVLSLSLRNTKIEIISLSLVFSE